MIDNKVLNLITLKLENLRPFQGDLKDLTEKNYLKLKSQIEKKGFLSPFHVWKNENEYYILDGHQRLKTLLKMADENLELPEKFPCVEIMAENYASAKEIVLSFASQYGELTGSGLYEFITEANISFDDITDNFNFPNLDLDAFKSEFLFNDPEDIQIIDADNISENYNFTIKCKSYDELEKIKGHYNANGSKITFEKFEMVNQ